MNDLIYHDIHQNWLLSTGNCEWWTVNNKLCSCSCLVIIYLSMLRNSVTRHYHWFHTAVNSLQVNQWPMVSGYWSNIIKYKKWDVMHTAIFFIIYKKTVQPREEKKKKEMKGINHNLCNFAEKKKQVST